MKTKPIIFARSTFHHLFIALALLGGVHQAAGQGSRFFRISGPTATTIIAFNANGTLVWSNAQPGATYTVQTLTSLSCGTDWVTFAQVPVTQAVNTNLLIDFNPPSGMALIPAGEFMMGDTVDIDGDAIPMNIYVSAFYMDANLVSSNQWRGVYSYATNLGYGFENAGLGNAANQPVYEVDWYDCVKWSNARSQQAGLTPVYYTDAGLTQVYTNGEVTPYVNWSASGYRLPTDAEWEKAARGGLSEQRFPWGATISESQANYFGDTNDYFYDLGPNGYNTNFDTGAQPYTSPVGYFAPNGYGVYDMAGNESVWCWDWYGTVLGLPTTTDPTGPATGSYRVLRGGYWSYVAYYARVAYRSKYTPVYAADYNGFRCVRGL